MLLSRIVDTVPTDAPAIAHAAAGAGITFGAIWANVFALIGQWPIWAAGLASLVMIFYYGLSTLQLPIVQTYLRQRRDRINSKKLVKLQARALRDEAQIRALTVVKQAQTEAAAIVETAKAKAAAVTSTPQH